jgi:hypothetical protein
MRYLLGCILLGMTYLSIFWAFPFVAAGRGNSGTALITIGIIHGIVLGASALVLLILWCFGSI